MLMTIHLNSGIGIIGTTTIATRNDGNSKTVEIKTTGTMKSYKIPAVIVFCEDELAKEIIIYSLREIDSVSHCSFKFIICGSWMNIITSLAGSLLYSDELEESGNTKILSTVGVIDGDITQKNIEDVISQCFKGNFVPVKLTQISKRIGEHLTHFKIPGEILNLKIKGKPEYNIKTMLEEIDEDAIDNILKPKLESVINAIKQNRDEHVVITLELEKFNLETEKMETLKIIQKSRQINEKKFKSRKQIKDYHRYLEFLEEEIGDEYYHSYPRAHFTLLILFRIISKFNKERWIEYVTPVTNLLIPVADRQRERFSHDTYNNDIID